MEIATKYLFNACYYSMRHPSHTNVIGTLESAFSIGGLVLNEKRSKMNKESVEICVRFKDWLDAAPRYWQTSNKF